MGISNQEKNNILKKGREITPNEILHSLLNTFINVNVNLKGRQLKVEK